MAKEVTVTIDAKAKTMTIVLPMQKATPSKSGKTDILASTGGSVDTGVLIGDKPLFIGVNAYTKK